MNAKSGRGRTEDADALALLTERDIARLWSKVDQTEGCWHWLGWFNKKGYAQFDGPSSTRGQRSKWRAHRLVYLLVVGDIPDGMVLDHTCRNRGCVNPWHLEPVTSHENTTRGDRGRKDGLCKNGHRVAEDGIWVTSNRDGRKYLLCRGCRRQWRREWKRRRRAAAQTPRTTYDHWRPLPERRVPARW